MSVQSEIARISGAKGGIKTAIEGKGVTVPSTTKIDGMAAYIDQIPTGGDECDMYAGSNEPSDAVVGDLWVDSSDESADLVPLLATENRTYNPSPHDGYSSVSVNVSGGGTECEMYTGKESPSGAIDGDLWVDYSDEPSGKAVQISNASNRRSGTSYAEISGISITVEKAGTYDVYWTGYRSATSGTFGTRLYVGSSSQGSAQTTFSDNEQHPHLSNVQLNANDTLTIRGRSGSTSNYIYASNLIIIEAGD